MIARGSMAPAAAMTFITAQHTGTWLFRERTLRLPLV